MSTNWGSIRVESRIVRIGPDQYVRRLDHVEWQGPPVALIDRRMLEQITGQTHEADDLVEIGPYLVRLVRFDYSSLAWETIRVGSLGAVRLWCRDVAEMTDLIYCRLLMMAAIWNLANYPDPGCKPTWHNVLARWRR